MLAHGRGLADCFGKEPTSEWGPLLCLRRPGFLGFGAAIRWRFLRNWPRLFYVLDLRTLLVVASLHAFNTSMNASWGILTEPNDFIRFFPSFCFSNSLRLRVMSPP